MDLDAIITKTNVSATESWHNYAENPEDKNSGEPQVMINLILTVGAKTPVHKAMLLSIEPSTFKYRFEGDESWYVLKGHVTITLEDGQKVEMKEGDIVSIKGGRNSTWIVHEKFEKFVVVTDATKNIS